MCLGDTMNHKQLLALFLCLVIIASSKIISSQNEIIKIKDASSNVDKYRIENYKDEDDTKSINLFFPVTDYKEVNELVNKKIDIYINRFNNATISSDIKKLEISFEEYEYKDYVSFKFNVRSNVGVSHDIDEVFTVVHKDGEIIDISKLKSKDANILNTLYDECYEKLKTDETMKEYSTEEWLKDGLEKSEDNYKSFILTPNSFVMYFNSYTVAPYVVGIVEVEIPYDKLINAI